VRAQELERGARAVGREHTHAVLLEDLLDAGEVARSSSTTSTVGASGAAVVAALDGVAGSLDVAAGFEVVSSLIARSRSLAAARALRRGRRASDLW
jgi:hypothetical protein